MRKISLFLLSAVLIDAAGVVSAADMGGNDCNRPKADAGAQYSLTLQLGQAQTIAQEALTVQLDDVMDSRCPVGAKCIWAGIAAVKLTVSHSGSVAQSLMLDTSTPQQLQPLQSTEQRILRVSLQSLDPIPSIQSVIAKEAYRATVLIEAQ
ncbi:MAG: hypothetical protein Q7R66_01065 [Undibacterium sp.]|uniref:hypothetical protein n=1 Tax=Undibacterium sp. TaxID=1914977 RepID=UPI00271C6865|nr:hypothetical protein [Undibacterium sp.]MDO8650768.1 hypothetical protein [Undibacterium sp.]